MKIWQHRYFTWAVYTAVALLVSLQRLVMTARLSAEDLERSRTVYENYVIFKNAFSHLLADLNPYAAYPTEQWDLFKYSPAFAVAMAPFAAVPDVIGLPAWNLLNALLPLSALWAIPVLTDQQRRFCAWFLLPELVISLQNSQSNGLTLGCMLWAYVAFEKGHLIKAAGWIAGATFIKIFGILALPLAFLYPRAQRSLLAIAAWCLLLFFLPLVVVGPGQLQQVYAWWLDLLKNDHAVSIGLSVQGWLESWFGLHPDKSLVLGVGVGLLGISIGAVYFAGAARHAIHGASVRALAWASVLIWVVIFNHKAESPTFVIALAGAALWYIFSNKQVWEKALLWIVFIFASLSPTDLFPRYLREHWVQPFVLKAVPCILLWAVISIYLFQKSRQART
jgi:hypothetical protein